MSKHRWWLDQFEQSLPVFVAEHWVSRNLALIQDKCEELGVDHLVQFVEGSYAKPRVGAWAVKHGGFVKLALEELRFGSELDREFYYKLTTIRQVQTPDESVRLAERMKEALGEAITETQWWKDNLVAIRKACGKVSKVKKVMES